MSIIASIYNKVCLISPRIEIALRKLYWHNAKYLKKYNPYKTKKVGISNGPRTKVDFSLIENYLRSNGIGEGCILIVHSSYDALETTGLSPDEIINRLLKLVGPTGTLAMPAIRKYKGEPKIEDILKFDTSNLVCTYNPRKTTIISGILPYTMLKRKDSVVSNHPYNPMVAIGFLAKAMMEHNLDGEYPSAHGPGSSWKFCYDNNAFVVGLGVDLNHYNTISHINEEAFGNWPYSDEEWYEKRKFIIETENNEKKEIVVNTRKPYWGMIGFAQLNKNKEIDKYGIIKRKKFGNDIIVCVEKAKEYVDHLQSLTKKGKIFYK